MTNIGLPPLDANARDAFPGRHWGDWLVFDPEAADKDCKFALEEAPDDLILSQADWFEAEQQFEYAGFLREFVRWRRLRLQHGLGMPVVPRKMQAAN